MVKMRAENVRYISTQIVLRTDKTDVLAIGNYHFIPEFSFDFSFEEVTSIQKLVFLLQKAASPQESFGKCISASI